MFTQSCIIRKNTKELVEKLEKMGYKYADNGAGIWLIPLEKLNYLGVNLYSRGKYMVKMDYGVIPGLIAERTRNFFLP